MKGIFTLLAAGLILPGSALHAQFAQQAQAIILGAVKVAVKPPPSGSQTGAPISFALQIQNGRSEPASVAAETRIDLQLLGSSGAIAERQACVVPARAPETRCTVPAPAAGLYKVRAIPSDKQLSEGSSYVLVRPAGRKPLAQPKKKSGLDPLAPFLRLAAYRPEPYFPEYQTSDSSGPPPPTAPAGTCGATQSPSHAKVILAINEGGEANGAFRAGVDTATIQAFFQADDGGSAPSDIRVWFSPDHGAVDHQPLVIPRCGISGEAQLSSQYPVKTTVSYTVLPRTYALSAPPALQATFVRAIIGIGTVPDGSQTLSLIDRVPVVAQFYDAEGFTAPTDSDRTVTFVSNNSVISPKDQAITVKAGQYSAETTILPYWFGSGTIFVSADRLKTASHVVAVTGGMVILVCLIGGLVGGLVSFFGSGGKIVSRLIVGAAAGILLAWAYIFGILPNLDASVAHNFFSVLAVSMIGGYSGIKVFDWIVKRFGWGAEEPAPAKS